MQKSMSLENEPSSKPLDIFAMKECLNPLPRVL